MKISSQPQEDQQVKLTVEFEPDVLEEYKRRAARRLSGRLKIPGFRPGKAPYAVILRQVGEGAILEEALDLLVDDKYPKIIEESGIHPYGPGSLENISSMDPPILEFIVPLQAEVMLGEYQSIRHPYEPPQIGEKEVEEVIDELRSQRAVIEPVNRPVVEGDVVTIKLHANRISDKVDSDDDENSSSVLIREMSTPIIVEQTGGAGRVDEWPFQGFSTNLIGLSFNDAKSFVYTYPDDTPYELLKGVEAEFHLVVEEIKARHLPEKDNDFAASIGEFTSMDELTERIRTNLELDSLNHYNDEYDSLVLKELVSQSEFRYPPQMLDDEVDSVINNLKNRLESQNQDIELYMKARGIDIEALRDESKPVAENRLKNTLALLELAKKEDIKIDEKKFEAEALQTMNSLMQSLPDNEARRLTTPNVYGNLMNNVMANMLTTEAYDLLREIASEKKASQVMAAIIPKTDNADIEHQDEVEETELVAPEIISQDSPSAITPPEE